MGLRTPNIPSPNHLTISIMPQLPRDASTARTPHPLVRFKTNKKIIVCCDGTREDGVAAKERWEYTNVLKLTRAFKQYDERTGNAIPQVVYYQPGIGSAQNLYSEYIQAATGASIGDKVREAYSFIAQNFHPGDEIFLFGFSRGAYTARIVAMFIGAIGVLNKTEMDHFADIFATYQKLGKSNDPIEIRRLRAELALWTTPTSPGKLRASSRGDPSFSIKCVGAFDTVGSIGLPEEVTHDPPSVESIFGFSNTELGEHVERAYQALAINENRLDFNCDKFEQTQGGRRKGQVLKQCWFSGDHKDVGGGMQMHDLSDLALFWMVSNIEDMLSVDLEYLKSLLNPVAPWGKQRPNNSRVGLYTLSLDNTRPLPTKPSLVTHETIHPSVLEQDHLIPHLRAIIRDSPSLVCSLLPFEEELKKNWPYIGKNVLMAPRSSAKMNSTIVVEAGDLWSVTRDILSIGKQSGTEIIQEIRSRVVARKNPDSKQ